MNVMAEQDTTYALSDLVKRRRAELGLSLRKFAEACIDPETRIQEIKHSWVDRLEKRLPVIPVGLPEVRALAEGLRVPRRVVQDAAGAQFLGIGTTDLEGDGRMRVLVNWADGLAPEDVERLVDIAKAWQSNRPDQDDSSM